MMRVILVVLSVIWVLSGTLVNAQNPYSIVRQVNQSIITNYDVSQRVRLLQSLGVNATDMRELALTQITEDKLKAQAAEAIGMTLTEEGYDQAFAGYARQREMSEGALLAQTQRAGVAPQTLRDFVSIGAMWRDLVNLKYRSRATPSEADIENILNYAASAARESVFIREIALPFAEHGVEGTQRLADQIIRNVKNGTSFAAMARQYSRTPTAANGGAVGWTPATRLPPALSGQLLTLEPGDIAAPLEVPAGIILIQLADIREDTTTASPDITASYIRLDVPVVGGDVASAQSDAQTLVEELDGCYDAESRAADFGAASGRYGPDALAAIPSDVALALANLDADESAIMAPSEAGISVLVLCSRAATADPEAISNLQDQVFAQRMNNYASSFLQELQADAIILDK